jgi:hypothetical protein
MSVKITLTILSGIAILLTACGSGTETPTASVTPSAASPSPASPVAQSTVASPAAVAKYGGQVVQTGDYHLELLPIPEGENMHVDFWLLKGANSTPVSDAKVTANIQFPNGTQKTVEMTYDQAGNHYKAYVPGYLPGDYRVVVQTEIQGNKVNGRFGFKL